MRIEELELFRRAAALGALSAAGRELGLSPAAASARLQSLERSLGATLFTRSTRKLTLTEEGESLLPHAEAALEALTAGRAAVRGAAGAPAGVLRAAVPAPFGQKHILPALPDFLETYSDVELDLHFSDEFVDLREGGYELAVRIGVLSDSALTATKLAPNRRMVIASPAYVAARGAPQTPEELGEHPCLISGDMRVWRLSRRGDAAERAIRVSGPLHANSGAVTRDAALLGLGVALKSSWDVGGDIREGRLVRLLPEWEVADAGAVWALRPPARFVSPRATAFVGFLKARFGPTPYWEAECG